MQPPNCLLLLTAVSETTKRLRIALIAEESAGVQTLRMLREMQHDVAVVLASPRQRQLGLANVWSVAVSLGYETWPAQLVKDGALAGQLAALDIDLILNVHSLYIIHGDILQAARIGAFNLHPGPLPRYAGLNAVSWAIYRGESVHGVTIHRMLPEVDTGPIAYQALFPISSVDSAFVVAARCIREGITLLRRLLETAVRSPDGIPAHSQDLCKREYFDKRVPEQGRISWLRPARNIVDFVRACDYAPFQSPWGHPKTCINGREIAISKARLSGQPCGLAAPGSVRRSGGVEVAAKDEWVELQQLVQDGRRVNPADVLNPGDMLQEVIPQSSEPGGERCREGRGHSEL